MSNFKCCYCGVSVVRFGLCDKCHAKQSDMRHINAPTSKDIATLFASADEYWLRRERVEEMSDGGHDTHGSN